MNKIPPFREPLSLDLRRQLQTNQPQTVAALRWFAIASLSIFVVLFVVALIERNTPQLFILSVGILPILVAIWLIRSGQIALPCAILAINLVLLITWLTTNGNGVYDAGVVAFPVILIITGLILREKFIAYLTGFIILALGWLVFGDILGVYHPVYPSRSNPQDFFIIAVITLIASNSIYLLVRNVHQNLERAEKEIEARQQVEQERERLIQELKNKNQELNRFAITVSHDLKTPLITISGFLGYLEKDARAGDYDRLHKNVTQINDAAKKMGRLVDQILDLSRIGRIINPPSKIAFGDIVQEALKLAEGPLGARRVEVRVGSDLPVVHVDRVRLVQVMQNLIINSVKFMGDQPDPCIEIGVQELEGQPAFFVRDNGIGIDPQNQSKIFELFNKLDPGTEGIGIGLSLVQRIIEVHGGKIWVQSEPDKGSTFFFTLEDTSIKEKS